MKINKSMKPLQFLVSSLLVLALLLGTSQTLAVQAEAEVDLMIEMKAPQHVAPSSDTVINLIYANKGTAASQAIEIVVTLPAGLDFKSAVDKQGNLSLPTKSQDGRTLTWSDLPALPLDSTWQHIWITTTVGADLPAGTELTTNAVIDSADEESITANNEAAVTSLICDMARSKKQANVQRAKPLDIVTFTVTIEMAADQQPQVRERVVQLTDFLPPATQAKFMGWEDQPPGATFDEQQQQLRWQGTLREDAPVMLRYNLGIVEDYPLGEPLLNRASLQWSEGGKQYGMDLAPVDLPIEMTENDHMFGPGGGEWQHSYGFTLDVPGNAVREATRFEFKPLEETPPDAPPGWMYARRAFEFNAYRFGETHQFNQPVDITLRYNQGDISGIYRNSLRLWYREGPGEQWADLGDPIQNRIGEITFRTNHFTEFALFGQPEHTVMIPLVQR